MRKTVFVSGASRGIGRAIALEFAKNDYDVAINCVHSIDKLNSLASEIEAMGCSCLKLVGDISDSDIVHDIFNDIYDAFGHLDVCVNNAGISKVGLFTDHTPDDWAEISSINLSSVVYCCSEAAKLMLKAHQGKIINITSMWGQVGASCEVMYSATKGGIDALTKALGKELAPSNIQVNAISCGAVDTDMNKCFSEEEIDQLCDEIPAGRMADPTEVAKLCLQLVTGNDYLTSQIIRIDGGFI